jgi:hypothetical protein
MSTPVLIGAVVASTALAAGGAVLQGVQARAAADFQADIARQNEALARERGELNADRARRVAIRRLGSLSAREASQDVLADAASELEMDVLLARFEGRLSARDARLAAGAAEFQGESAFRAGIIGGVGAALQGIGTIGMLARTPGPGTQTATGATSDAVLGAGDPLRVGGPGINVRAPRIAP